MTGASLSGPESGSASGPHADALAALRGWTCPTRAQEALRTAYVAHLEAHPDGVLRDCAPDHLTASALVLSADRSQVLLTLHRKARRWFQLGGHIEPDDPTLAAAALREAREESGIPDLTVGTAPLQLDTHPVRFCHPGLEAHHLDVRYVVSAPADAVASVSEESTAVRWWPVDGLPTTEPGIVELVRLALAAPL